ncbi:MAG: GNAT family N-acetyltransferase [Gemmatimonas sp.]|nr:GNAT family N-acetyltransferase [Gemmatimonas sp.]
MNSDGEAESDSVVVEHNRVLAVPGNEKLAVEALSDWIERQSIDEFVVAGASEDERSRLLDSFRCWIPEVEQRSAPFVDLAELRAKGESHLEAVSSNTRAQLRRSKRAYEMLGELQVRVAQTVEEALEFFQELIVLHEKRWEKRGFAGAFASAARKSFHLDFIRSAFDEGRVHLLRVVCGSDTVGILYNFQANGYVSFYQSGFDYPADRRLKPGLLTHHMAIEHYRTNNFLEYDFLASEKGEFQYKRSLSTGERPLFWVSFSRPGTKHRFLRCLRWFRETRRLVFGSPAVAQMTAEV